LQRTLIIYESENETTEKMVKYLSLIMGPAKVCRVEEFSETYKYFDLYIIGSPIYENKLDGKILKFTEDNIGWLKEKKVALFCDCLEKDAEGKYLKPLNQILKDKVIYSKAISDEKEIIKFALLLKEISIRFKKKVPEETVKGLLETFLHSHNTCTLCTANEGNVRGTAIEYFYKKGHVYMLTEGGEKFANILLNPNVSICIYSYHKNMSKLNGIQANGYASLVDMNSKEYSEIVGRRGIRSEQLNVFPAYLNLLKVKLNKAEYYSYKFSDMGYEARQDYIF